MFGQQGVIPFNGFSAMFLVTVSQAPCTVPGMCGYELNGFQMKDSERRQDGRMEGKRDGKRERGRKEGREGGNVFSTIY